MKKYFNITRDGYSILDENTGELLEYKQVKHVTQEEFIMVFLLTVPEFIKLPGNMMRLLVVLWKLSTFNSRGEADGNVVYNDISTKEAIRALGLNLADKTIDFYFSQLSTQTDFLIKKNRGRFILNPKYFFKGTIIDAAKMQLLITTENVKID